MIQGDGLILSQQKQQRELSGTSGENAGKHAVGDDNRQQPAILRPLVRDQELQPYGSPDIGYQIEQDPDQYPTDGEISQVIRYVL